MSKNTIRPCGNGGNGVEVTEWHTYPRHSVLSGQRQEIVVGFFDSVEEAKKEFPRAVVSEDFRSSHRPMVSNFAPSDFDPHYAGERWDSDY
jgi:hypothetical protein